MQTKATANVQDIDRIKSLENQVELLKLYNDEVIKILEEVVQDQVPRKSFIEKVVIKFGELKKYRRYNQFLNVISSPYNAYKSVFDRQIEESKKNKYQVLENSETDKKESSLSEYIKNLKTEDYILLITPAYPSKNNIYRGAFIKNRVDYYTKSGKKVLVFNWRAHRGSDIPKIIEINSSTIVIEASQENLTYVIENYKYKGTFVHFINQDIYDTLSRCEVSNYYVWSHGSDVISYKRRLYDLSPTVLLKTRDNLIQHDNEKRKLFSRMFSDTEVTNVFVSNFLKEIAEQDIGMKSGKFEIIHNHIDTNAFTPTVVAAERRKNILFIRPFESYNYGADIMEKTILELSKSPIFEDITFTICGDGSRHEEFTSSLSGFKNVKIRKRFFSKEEMIALFQEHGLSLIPTRFDTQGISMGEAMSCGSVVITNSVASIPEFADSSCAMLCPNEDYRSMARCIEELYDHPELFLELSKEAPQRVRRQCSEQYTIERELSLLSHEDS